jgi:hypothetical protein
MPGCHREAQHHFVFYRLLHVERLARVEVIRFRFLLGDLAETGLFHEHQFPRGIDRLFQCLETALTGQTHRPAHFKPDCRLAVGTLVAGESISHCAGVVMDQIAQARQGGDV